MTNHNLKTSPQIYARTGGLLYLIIIATGLFGEIFVRGQLIVSGDAVTTASRILASQSLWRLGVAGDILQHVCDIGLMLVFYLLLRPVSKTLALLALLLNLIQTAVLVAYKLNLLMALFLLGSADYLKAFDPRQLDALTYVFIRADAYGFGIGLIFFGFTCLVLGYLMFRSGYLPRILGALMSIAGLCYLINSFALLLAPAFADRIFPAILLPAFIGESSICLWLLIKGVNIEQWNKLVPESA